MHYDVYSYGWWLRQIHRRAVEEFRRFLKSDEVKATKAEHSRTLTPAAYASKRFNRRMMQDEGRVTA